MLVCFPPQAPNKALPKPLIFTLLENFLRFSLGESNYEVPPF